MLEARPGSNCDRANQMWAVSIWVDTDGRGGIAQTLLLEEKNGLILPLL